MRGQILGADQVVVRLLIRHPASRHEAAHIVFQVLEAIPRRELLEAIFRPSVRIRRQPFLFHLAVTLLDRAELGLQLFNALHEVAEQLIGGFRVIRGGSVRRLQPSQGLGPLRRPGRPRGGRRGGGGFCDQAPFTRDPFEVLTVAHEVPDRIAHVLRDVGDRVRLIERDPEFRFEIGPVPFDGLLAPVFEDCPTLLEISPQCVVENVRILFPTSRCRRPVGRACGRGGAS